MDVEKIKKLAGIKTSGDYLKIIKTDKKTNSDSQDKSQDLPDDLDNEITSFDDVEAQEKSSDITDDEDIETFIHTTYVSLREKTWEFVDNFFIDMEQQFGGEITNDFINNKYSQENYTYINQEDLIIWVSEKII